MLRGMQVMLYLGYGAGEAGQGCATGEWLRIIGGALLIVAGALAALCYMRDHVYGERWSE